MKITKVSYQKAFITGPFLQEKIGFEAEIDEHIQSVHDALTQLKGMTEDFHKESNPHLYQEPDVPLPHFDRTPTYMPLQPGHLPTISKDTERLEILIDNATSLESLAEIKDACGKAGLITAYMQKLNKLMTNGAKEI